MTGQGLCKDERLHSLRRIRNLFGFGESGFVYPYRYTWTVYESGPQQLPLGSGGRIEPKSEPRAKSGTRAKSGRSARRVAAESPSPVSVESGVSMMVSVPKKHHKRANKRNLLRRRTKEALRLDGSIAWVWPQESQIYLGTATVLDFCSRPSHSTRYLL